MKIGRMDDLLEEMNEVQNRVKRAEKVQKGTATVQEYQQYCLDTLKEKFDVALWKAREDLVNMTYASQDERFEIYYALKKYLIEMNNAFQDIQAYVSKP